MDIHIALAFDQRYKSQFYALFTSIAQWNIANHIKIHAIVTGLNESEQREVITYVKSLNAELDFYEADLNLVQTFILRGTWSAAVYYRLLFPFLLDKDLERVLYLDTDIVVIDDLKPLFLTALDGFPVGAVYDNWVEVAPQLGITEKGNYFNSGVMLIDLQAWRRQRISELTFEYLRSYPERIRFVDQCALNAVLKNNWKQLDWRYNVLFSYIPQEMDSRERKNFLKEKVLLHYTLERPWHMLCKNPYRSLYFQYVKQSPMKGNARYADYDYRKLPAYLRIRIIELYWSIPFLMRTWRFLKASNLLLFRYGKQ